MTSKSGEKQFYLLIFRVDRELGWESELEVKLTQSQKGVSKQWTLSVPASKENFHLLSVNSPFSLETRPSPNPALRDLPLLATVQVALVQPEVIITNPVPHLILLPFFENEHRIKLVIYRVDRREKWDSKLKLQIGSYEDPSQSITVSIEMEHWFGTFFFDLPFSTFSFKREYYQVYTSPCFSELIEEPRIFGAIASWMQRFPTSTLRVVSEIDATEENLTQLLCQTGGAVVDHNLVYHGVGDRIMSCPFRISETLFGTPEPILPKDFVLATRELHPVSEFFTRNYWKSELFGNLPRPEKVDILPYSYVAAKEEVHTSNIYPVMEETPSGQLIYRTQLENQFVTVMEVQQLAESQVVTKRTKIKYNGGEDQIEETSDRLFLISLRGAKPKAAAKPGEQKIPRIIHQTFITRQIGATNIKVIEHLRALNPEYEYHFYTDEEAWEIIRQHMPKDVLKTFDLLVAGAFKADLFRLCLLYIYGGVYIDHHLVARVPLRYFVPSEKDFFLCKDRAKFPRFIYNALMGATPKHILIKRMIQRCVDNILNHKMGEDEYDITGPLAIGKLYCEFKRVREISLGEEVILYHEGGLMSSIYDRFGTPVFYSRFPEYDSARGKNHYHTLWRENRIFASMTDPLFHRLEQHQLGNRTWNPELFVFDNQRLVKDHYSYNGTVCFHRQGEFQKNLISLMPTDEIFLVFRSVPKHLRGTDFPLSDLGGLRITKDALVYQKLFTGTSDLSLEDPRFFLHKGTVSVACAGMNSKSRTVQMVLRNLQNSTQTKFSFGKEWEKNWTFFTTPSGETRILYHCTPVTVYDLELKTVIVNSWSHPSVKLYGGSPPLWVGDRYYVFCHSRDEKCQYNIYVLTLSADFEVLGYTEQGLLQKNYDEIYFVTDAIFMYGHFYLLMGINDRNLAFWRISKEGIEKQMKLK
jgi:mannosyltransferase OCH1-like enzyme